MPCSPALRGDRTTMETVSRGSLRRKEVGSSAKADAELVDLGDIRRRLARLDEQEVSPGARR